MSDVTSLIASLSAPQRTAIDIIKIALNCYNSKDGTGLFTGAERYAILTARVEIAAIQSKDLFAFWSRLQRRMMWSIPPRQMDDVITAALQQSSPEMVLRALATETASVVMLARMLHTTERETLRKERKSAAVDFEDDDVFGDDV